MNRTKTLKKYFLYLMIGALVGGGVVAIVSVLAGTFNEVSQRVTAALVSVIVHSLVSFLAIDDGDSKRVRRLSLFYEVFFIIVVLSLFTSLFAIFGAIGEEITAQLYGCYAVVSLTALVSSILLLFRGKSTSITASMWTGIGSTSFLALLTILLIIATSAEEEYYRVMGASGILMAVSIVVTVVLYKLYLQSHPNETSVMKDPSGRGPLYTIGRIVLIVIGLFLLLNILSWAFIAFAFRSF